MSHQLRRVLCLAILPVAWAGTEAVVPPAGGRLLVTAERGLLTVVADAIELQAGLPAITRQSGSPIMLVNAPAEPLPVTVTIERRPHGRAESSAPPRGPPGPQARSPM